MDAFLMFAIAFMVMLPIGITLTWQALKDYDNPQVTEDT